MNKNLIISFVGAGNLATNLAQALYRNGLRIKEIYSRTEASARTLASLVNANWTTNLQTLNRDSDIYFVCLTDSALESLVGEIVKERENSLFLHTSGSVSIDVWKGKCKKCGVFYPMQTFSKQRLVDFKTIPLFLEVLQSEDKEFVEKFAKELSQSVYFADSQQRMFLHLAAVFTCNFTNYLYAVADKLVTQNHLPFEVFLPLISETAKKVELLRPREAQTGPASRGDDVVIQKHLAVLKEFPEERKIYAILSDCIKRMKQQK